jgi:hypothetical protein
LTSPADSDQPNLSPALGLPATPEVAVVIQACRAEMPVAEPG